MDSKPLSQDAEIELLKSALAKTLVALGRIHPDVPWLEFIAPPPEIPPAPPVAMCNALCQACRGGGFADLDKLNFCHSCHGSGSVAIPKSEAIACQACCGKGYGLKTASVPVMGGVQKLADKVPCKICCATGWHHRGDHQTAK